MVLPGVQEIVGCPPTSSLCHLPRQSEFPLTPWQRQSPCAKGGWGLTYANKTMEVQQVLVAGSTMKDLPRNRKYKWVIKQITVLFYIAFHS